MAVRTQSPLTGQSSRMSRFASLGFKPANAPQLSSKRESEEDWYIPYNGPYELPDESESDANRDSWGQVIDVTGREVHRRPADAQEGRSRPRARVTSNVSIVTKSSGAIDPSRGSFSSTRHPVPTSSTAAPPLPSYVDLDLTGGVGGSPSPRQQTFTTSAKRNRSPFRSLFSKRTQSPPMPGTNSLGYAAQALTSPDHGKSRAEPSTRLPGHETLHNPTLGQGKQPAAGRSDHGAMFSDQPHLTYPSHHDLPDPAPHPPHPYAATFASSRSHLVVPGDDPFSAPPGKMFPNASPPFRQFPSLHTSASTPNLRKTKPSPFSRARDRWFSAETWCDAILFPKPRFKIKEEGQFSRRIVSPPGSPLLPNEKLGQGAESHPSRALAHSRSMAEMRTTKEGEASASTIPPERQRPPDIHLDVHHTNAPAHDGPSGPEPLHHGGAEISSKAAADKRRNELHLPRPRSFALDDLALPSPIPSLSTVLEQGRQLDQQRQAWQSQATHSFQNKRGRSVSRHRTKSAGANGKKAPGTATDFLAARAWLGRQTAAPAVVISTPCQTDESSRKTHSQKNSLSKTISTRSSKSQAQIKGHSRDGSWSKSALKKAKGSVVGCVQPDATLTPQDERAMYPHFIPQVERVSPIGSLAPSPTPSSVPASQVGLAISGTPPPRSYDEVSVQMSSHPYAQGGAYSQVNHHSEDLRSMNGSSHYAGPHPIQYEMNPAHNGGGHLVLVPSAPHPYAAHREDESKATPRFGGSAPWVSRSVQDDQGYSEGSSGYGTFLSADSSSSRMQRKLTDRVSIGEALSYSMLQPGDRDSGLGTSEDHGVENTQERTHAQPIYGQVVQPQVIATNSTDEMNQGSLRRKPVQYNVHQPLHSVSHVTSTAPSHVTIGSIGSSFLENATHDIPRPANDRHDSSGELASGASSPPISPPPLGNFDDMDNFRDLFYRPGKASTDTDASSTIASNPNRRTASSGLTTLTRQLSQELAQLQHVSHGGVMVRSESDQPNSLSNLHFVLESDHLGADPRLAHPAPLQLPPHKIQAFQPSGNLPEDVASSRASSPLEGTSEDGHAFHFGSVNAVTTPSVYTSDYRISQRLSLVHEDFAESPGDELPTASVPVPLPPRNSDLLVPNSANSYSRVSSGGFNRSRSSQMTSSDAFSRMSGLSDFPSPPENTATPAHLSVINSFFSPAVELDEHEAFFSKENGPKPVAVPATERPQMLRRYTFGTNEDGLGTSPLSANP